MARVSCLGGWLARGRGVIGRPPLAAGEGVWLPRTASVHTVFVGFPLDILFLSSDFCALRAFTAVPPGRLLVQARGAAHALELGAGTLLPLLSRMAPGDLWRLSREL